MLMKVTTTKPLKAKRAQATCRCKAYPFPHREGSGKCYGSDAYAYCGECGKPCTPEGRDVGIGAYEYWGTKGVDSRIVCESRCCDAKVFSNAELTIEYTGRDD